jgi:hypothetical protein
MAEKTTAKAKTETAKDEFDLENLNLDAKVTVRNLAGWGVGFARIHENGDVNFAPNGKQRLSRNEVQAQVNNNNRLFVGTDGQGSHATIYIEDAATRRLVGFEDEGRAQLIFTDETAKKLFNMNYAAYEAALPELVKTDAERNALMEAIRRLNLNDYKKIIFAEKYTGYRF